MPAVHSEHDDRPEEEAKDPASQSVHSVAPDDEIVPGRQIEHVSTPDVELYFPLAHAEHT